jgi:hypothetical protein
VTIDPLAAQILILSKVSALHEEHTNLFFRLHLQTSRRSQRPFSVTPAAPCCLFFDNPAEINRLLPKLQIAFVGVHHSSNSGAVVPDIFASVWLALTMSSDRLKPNTTIRTLTSRLPLSLHGELWNMEMFHNGTLSFSISIRL